MSEEEHNISVFAYVFSLLFLWHFYSKLFSNGQQHPKRGNVADICRHSQEMTSEPCQVFIKQRGRHSDRKFCPGGAQRVSTLSFVEDETVGRLGIKLDHINIQQLNDAC